MWFKVYVGLAVASLGIACLSIWLSSTLITAHRESVLFHAGWSERLASLGELTAHADAIQGVISGAYIRQDPESGRAALARGLLDFERVASACLQDAPLVPDRALASTLSHRVMDVRAAAAAMAEAGERMFDQLAGGDLGSAGHSLARANGAYARVQAAMVPLRQSIADSISTSFQAQLRQSEQLELIQYAVTILVCSGVIAAMWYGRRLREATLEAERQHAAFISAMAERRDAAEAASRSKSEFLANMSHEIRTPMTAMLGYADLLAEPDHGASERADCIRIIRQNGEHLLAILNDILDLSKIEAGRMTLERADCSLLQIIEEIYSLMQPRAVEHGVILRTDYRFPLPRIINCDPLRLKQIILNLVSNAIKFSPRGSVVVTAELREPEAGQLAVTIADTGIGMSREQIAMLFQPFTQGDGSTTRRFGGTGLGLSISSRLARLMDAEITVHSEPGKGSTFTLLLNLGSIETAALAHSLEDATLSPVTPAAAAVHLSGRVLLAEDGPDNQRLITTFLKRAGAEVEVAGNGRIAVDRALAPGKAPFDLVLMDMQMPELDGYAAARLLRVRGYRGPILALTAHAMPGERQRCLAAGCDDYLTKPIERHKFLQTCRDWMERGRSAAAA
jgi:signal transduction histidine kinase/ActR/RegA family two-component response regulator